MDLLLDAAATGLNTVEREGISYTHSSRFVLIGSMNPEEGNLRPLKEFGIFITNHPDMVVGAYGAKQKGEICEAPYLCETVDECCFEMTCECFNRLRFNEEVCDGWDLYAVEMCLRGKDNVTRGEGGYNPGIKHFSGGNVDSNYMIKFKQLLSIYHHEGYICTTCESMPCNLFYYYVYFSIWSIKKKLLGNYPSVKL